LVLNKACTGKQGNDYIGCWLLAVGCWLLAVGYWLLAVGYWLLAVGCWQKKHKYLNLY